MNQKELKYNNLETIRLIQNNTVAVMESVDLKADAAKNRAKEKMFTFDYAFDKTANQVSVII